eukprot:CAMPEP_0119572270 /NCGR_PEP_ID=MMETSP1352-20130426/44536_1 /TAXON_ID=265584 /ORGANISM="Stauroneis constricta, Strain CCMP1120" /LENGTH=454 /DNA_ID=CAMNT_0007621955 /DNA_START=62 /DNA_END=1426 /DNA_ORIENTATION=+
MTAHKFWYDSIPHGYEQQLERDSYRSDMIPSSITHLPELQMMDDNDYHEHMLLKALDEKELHDVHVPLHDHINHDEDEHHNHNHSHSHCSLPSLNDDDESYALIDEKPLLEDDILPLVSPIKSGAASASLIFENMPTAAGAEEEEASANDADIEQNEQQSNDADLEMPELTPTMPAPASTVTTSLKNESVMLEPKIEPVSRLIDTIETAKVTTAAAAAGNSTTTTAVTRRKTAPSKAAKAIQDEKKEAAADMVVESEGPACVAIPSKFDVLCGQSRICANHTGNRRFQVVLDIYASTYQKANTKQEKMSLTKEIVGCIASSGGRFLKYKDGVWAEIPTVTARDKVSHALRTKVASWKRQQQASPSPASSPARGSARRAGRKPARSKSALVQSTSKSNKVTKHRKRRSSTSIALHGSFDSTSSNVMDDLLKSQREIFASLKSGGQFKNDVHPLKK